MEYIDIIDQNGNPTGVSKPKDEVHRDGDLHKSVHVWILNSKKELLVQKRAKTKINYPDLWDISIAGHISAGETSIQTALREAEEELGIELNDHDFVHIFVSKSDAVLNNGTYIEKELHDVYVVQKDLDISKLKLQESEVAEVKWISVEELEKACTDPKLFVPQPDEYPELFKYISKLEGRSGAVGKTEDYAK